MKKLGFEDGKEDGLVKRRRVLSAEVEKLQDTVNALTARYVLRFYLKTSPKLSLPFVYLLIKS